MSNFGGVDCVEKYLTSILDLAMAGILLKSTG